MNVTHVTEILNIVAPTLIMVVLGGLGVVIRFLVQLKQSAARVEAKQSLQDGRLEAIETAFSAHQEADHRRQDAQIVALRERASALEGATFKRPPILEDPL